MTVKILLISKDLNWISYLGDELRKIGSFSIIAVASDLEQALLSLNTYNPAVILVSQNYVAAPDFQSLLSNCSVKNIGWVMIANPNQKNKARSVNMGYGSQRVVSILKTDPIREIARKLKAAINAVKPIPHALSGKSSLAANTPKLVLLGASTGGIEALSTILQRYPSDCPPTLIVQHTGAVFGETLIELLNKNSPAKVLFAKDGRFILPGHVVIAAGKRLHMEVSPANPTQIRMVSKDPVSGHIPSVDALFESAIPIAKRCVAGVLTGMGKDGATQLLTLRKNGAETFAQDEESSVVYGMPRVAWDNGGAKTRVPIDQVASHILNLCAEPPRF